MGVSRNSQAERSLLDEVSAVLETAGIDACSRLCCALSGGVDSVVLLDLLVELRSRLGFDLQAAHVHHGLNPSAGAWRDFCVQRCAALAVPLQTFAVEVVRDHPDGLEAAARVARHDALKTVVCDWLVFGHHRDDQAETLLFRLFRGTGVRGAGAMRAVETGAATGPGRLRPLLEVGRRAILVWARRRHLQWVEDDSNRDRRFARNDIRHRILPAIESAFPAASTSIARAATHFREAGALLDELAEEDARRCGGDVLGHAALLRLSDARLANLLRWQARCRGAEASSRARLFEAMRQLRTSGATHPLRVDLGPLSCCAYRGEVWLEWTAAALPAACEVDLSSPTPVSADWGEGRVVFRGVRGEGIARSALACDPGPRLVPRFAGLRLRLAMNRPPRSFKNLCQEAAIPPWMRDRLPVLEIDGRVAWIGGIGVDAAFACPPQAEGVLPEWVPIRS
ncbi:tRNA lysidine(34) synthetase TilS [Azoarcus sp. L1K30]|uniref:tRNA lysidine(34) synthetase TilS n=1 Tax=Azoarcus sp. L1K30 TaxID=2820277 RepID=UPI001B8294A3|nr:tRNA lysidine(34) synthetase TilS [Azoarcus sp. L1K30]MBR0566641.1 tRNA lysidine(34) synthetase TilS [Azoarcus sp. L1K30]